MSEDANWIEFQPFQEDLAKVLGDLEADVMKCVWEVECGNVKEIHKHLNKKRQAAVTTVATVLDRLHHKGLVDRQLFKEGGIRYEYSPSMTRQQFENTVVRNIFKGLFETFGDTTISYLVQSMRIQDEGRIQEIKKNLERLKEER